MNFNYFQNTESISTPRKEIESQNEQMKSRASQLKKKKNTVHPEQANEKGSEVTVCLSQYSDSGFSLLV